MIRGLKQVLTFWCTPADRRRDSGQRARRQMEIEPERLMRQGVDRIGLV